MSPKLSDIHIYPIKSTGGISLSSAWVDDLGLSFDRRFVLSDKNGQFITARKKPKLALIQANLIPDGLILTAPNMPTLTLKYQELMPDYQTVTVWRDDIQGQLAPETCHKWFSDYLELPCQLLFFGEKSTRQVKNKDNPVSFADGYPLLIISQASLEQLNHLSTRNNEMSQFRPNIVVDDCLPFAEDGWQKIKIGEVIFEISKPCARCIFTTINPETGTFDKSREPLTTLAKFRKGEDNEIYFGQNLIPLNTGQIKVGDKVEILASTAPEKYVNNTGIKLEPLSDTSQAGSLEKTTKTTKTQSKINEEDVAKVNIKFDSWNIEHQGNTKDTLLEQGEEAGLIMHYSCRGGNCGRCKVKLQSGDVQQLTTDGLLPQEEDEGYILACSSIPTSDLVITKD